MNHHQDYINAVALIAFALGFLGGMLWTVIGFRVGRWLKLRKIRRKRKMFWIRLRMLWMVALLCLPTQSWANELSLDLAVAIAKARLAIKVTPPKVEPLKASGFSWSSYAEARKAHLSDAAPLVVMTGAEWCGPCKTLKTAISNAKITGLNYAYVDVDEDGPTVALLGYSGNFTIPKLRVYLASGAFDVDTSSAPAAVEYLRRQTKDAKTVSASAEPYSYRVQRIAAPRGYSPAYVAGMSFYTHVVRDHGHQIRDVLNRVDIRGMSEHDLFALHGMLHSNLSVGYWQGNVFLFQLP